MPKDEEALLQELERQVAASPAAQARWNCLPSKSLAPLIDWVCAPRFAFLARRRIAEAVALLERTPLNEVGGVRSIDLVAPPGIVGPSIWDAF